MEDCDNVRVAPYTWNYPGLEEDFVKAGLDKNVNHWKEVRIEDDLFQIVK